MIDDPITEDQVFERLRTHLATRGLALRRGTLDGMKHDARGRFYLTRAGSDEVLEDHVALDRRAREEGVLKPNEALVPTEDKGAP